MVKIHANKGSGLVIRVKKPTNRGWSPGFWLYKSQEARRKAGPKTPLGPSPSLRQQKVQTMLQLMYANKALNAMRIRGSTSGPPWNEATNLKNTARFSRKAQATPFPS
jgi:hypothetical protein